MASPAGGGISGRHPRTVTTKDAGAAAPARRGDFDPMTTTGDRVQGGRGGSVEEGTDDSSRDKEEGGESQHRSKSKARSLSSSSTSSPSRKQHRASPSTNTLTALLEPFNTGDGKIPETSRAGADVAEQRTASQIGLLESWKYLPFLAHQATSLASAFVSHHLYGPRKPSWGIELTLFTTAVRESVQYSHLSSLNQLRKFLNLGQILPTPGDGVVTPVTFRVKRRGLRGLLKDLDDKEDGRRELTGEWIVSKRIWRRMQSEHYGKLVNARSRPAYRATSSNTDSAGPAPTSASTYTSSARHGNPQGRTSSQEGGGSTSRSAKENQRSKDKVILYLHGGAYYVMSAATHRYITISMSKYTDCRVFAVNYRLAPECRWPGQIHDAVQSYMRLLYDLKIAPEDILICGDSAGGGLCLATLMYLRDNGYPLPCGAIVMSPWVDLTMSCDSWETNAAYDYLRMPSGDDHMNPIASYLGAANVKSLITNPYVSPLFGDFTGLPPLLIQCGDAECLRDEGTLLAHKASLAGVQVFHEVYEDCPHVFQALFFLDAAKKAFRSHRNFVKRILPTASIPRSDLITSKSIIDHEVMSDAHAIKPDGQPEENTLSPDSDSADLTQDTPARDIEADEPVDGYSLGQPLGGKRRPTHNDQHEVDLKEDELHEGEPISNAILRGLGGVIKLASKVSPAQHHDLDRVEEEQDESVSEARQEERSASDSRTPSRRTSISAPSSPSALKNRHRSLSSLSITSLLSNAPHRQSSTTVAQTSSSHGTAKRPGHSRTNSAATLTSKAHTLSSPSSRPAIFREHSRPRVRANSHPDLQALLESYDANPDHHTVLWQVDDGGDGDGDGDGDGEPEGSSSRPTSGSDTDEGNRTPTEDEAFSSIDAIEEQVVA